jgi:hypothetical protein
MRGGVQELPRVREALPVLLARESASLPQVVYFAPLVQAATLPVLADRWPEACRSWRKLT